MLELFVQDINQFKFYFFILLFFILFPIYLYIAPKDISKYTIILISLFFIIVLHSIFISYDSSSSVKQSIYALIILIDLYMIIKIINREIISTYYKRFIIIISIIIIGSSNLIVFLYNSTSFYHDSNFHGIIQNSNTLALYLAVFISPYLFHELFINSKTKFIFIIKFTLIIDVFFLLLITHSRTSIVVFLIIGIYYFLFNNPRLKSKLIGIVILLFIISTTLFLTSNNINKYLYKNNNTQTLTSTRDLLWIARLKAINEKPYFGWGYQVNEYNYVDKYNQFNKLEKGNTLLAIIEEFGIIFGIIFIIILNYLFYQVYLKLKYIHELSYVTVTLIAVLFHSLLETWLFNFNGLLAIFFWMIIISSFETKTIIRLKYEYK